MAAQPSVLFVSATAPTDIGCATALTVDPDWLYLRGMPKIPAYLNVGVAAALVAALVMMYMLLSSARVYG